MSQDDNRKIPYREGESPPAGYVLVQDEDGNRFWARPGDIHASQFRHEALPPELLPLVRWQWRHLREHLRHSSFEEWEAGYLRDTNPDREIAHWTRTTYAFLTFLHRNPRAPASEVARAVFAIGVGLKSSVQPKKVRRELMRLLEEPDRRITDPDNFTADGRLIGGGYLE